MGKYHEERQDFGLMDDTWELDVPPLPERSRLYPLEPIGIGTPDVESLTSYVIRLAQEHCVLPKTLVIHELLPLLVRQGVPEASARYPSATWVHVVQALNGTGDLARSGADALEKLTTRHDLRTLTMLMWANVISKKGLLRETQAWCPLCYEEWRGNRKIMYSPLLWSLKAVKMCLHHQRPLQECCPSPQCQKKLPIVATQVRLGYCPHCNYWLGNVAAPNFRTAEAVTSEESQQVYWEAIALGELLQTAPDVSAPLQRADLASALDLLIDRMPDKEAASLAHLLNLKPQAITDWQRGLLSPRVETLLHMCRLLSISPKQLFFESSDSSFFTNSRWKAAIDRLHLTMMRLLSDSEEERRNPAEMLASDEEPAPSIQEAARRLGYRSKSSLYKRFPELAYAITAKHQKYQRPQPTQKMSSDELRQALEAVLVSDEEPPPSLQEVAQRLGYQTTSSLRSRFPELSRAIIAKYQKYNPRRREPMGSDELRQALETELASDEECPPSLQEVAQRLGYRDASSLRSRFPELARAITAKYQKHHQRDPMSFDELRQALETALASDEEPPPSLYEVAQRLGYQNASPLHSQFPELSNAITAKYQRRNAKHKRGRSSDELRQALEAVLASDEEPPPSLKEVAQRLGYRSPGPLYSRFPELSRAITAKNQKYNPRRREPMESDELRQALEAVLANDEEPPPSLKEVAQRLGYQGASPIQMRFPELAQAITAQYHQGYPYFAFLAQCFPQLPHALSLKRRNSEDVQHILETLLESADPMIWHQQQIRKRLGYSLHKLHHCFPELSDLLQRRLIPSSDLDIEELQVALEKELLSENEPRSLAAVARSFGYPVQILKRFFPSVCQQIIAREKLHRKKRRELRQQKIQEEVQRVVLHIHAEYKYPSFYQVLKHIDRFCVCPPVFYLEAYVPWRKLLEDLDYER
jgi:AraC-like DNA-binding protein